MVTDFLYLFARLVKEADVKPSCPESLELLHASKDLIRDLDPSRGNGCFTKLIEKLTWLVNLSIYMPINPVHLSHRVILQILLLFVASSITAAPQETDLVNLPDPALEAGIREALSIPDGLLTRADLEALTELSITNAGIADLTGLEHAINLTVLHLGNNQIRNIGALSGLASLLDLRVSHNQISDMSPVAGLEELIIILGDDNEISDVSPLSGLTNLKVLSLSENEISDIGPLSGLIELTGLWLSRNQISDISAVSGLVNLETFAILTNQISDISPLSGLIQLTRLSLSDNPISDLSALAELNNLYHLDLIGNQVRDISVLSGLVNLTQLFLPFNEISDIRPLSSLTQLSMLQLDANLISDITPLAELVDLQDDPAFGAGLTLLYNHLDIEPGSDTRQLLDDMNARAGLTVEFEPQDPFVRINPVEYDVDASGGTYDITVTSSTNWPVSESLEWVRVSRPAGKGNGQVSIIFERNTDANPRIGEVQIGDVIHILRQDADTDRDGISNIKEELLGTDPLDPSSCLKLRSAGCSGTVDLFVDGRCSWRFDAVSGVKYHIMQSETLDGDWVPAQLEELNGEDWQAVPTHVFQFSEPTESIIVTAPVGGAMFYRIDPEFLK